MSIDPHFAPHSGRDLGPWKRWVEERLKYLASGRNLIERGSVAGGAVTIQQILTNPARGISFMNTDVATAVGPGTFVMQLTYEPMPGSLQIWWGSKPMPPTGWSVSGNLVTIFDDTTHPHIKTGRKFTAYYAVEAATAEPIAPVTPSIGWASSGPNKIVVENDTTDYSALAYDDSLWPYGAAPVGNPLVAPGGAPVWWSVPGTPTGSTDVGIWMRRTIQALGPCTFTINARVDGQWWLYLDGTLLGSNASGASWATPGPYTASAAYGRHVVALHVNDDTLDPPGDAIFADLNVTVS